MNEWFDRFEGVPDTADALLAEAIKCDMKERLEQAMLDDAVLLDFLSSRTATVEFDVVIDRGLGGGELAFIPERAENEPFAASIGLPAVTAMVASMRRRLEADESAWSRLEDESFCFEISVHPDAVTLSEA